MPDRPGWIIEKSTSGMFVIVRSSGTTGLDLAFVSWDQVRRFIDDLSQACMHVMGPPPKPEKKWTLEQVQEYAKMLDA